MENLLRNILGLLTTIRHHVIVSSRVPDKELSVLRDDDDDNVLPNPALLKLKADVDDDALIKIKYRSGEIVTLAAWKFKAACPEIIKVYATPTTVTNDQMFLIQ